VVNKDVHSAWPWCSSATISYDVLDHSGHTGGDAPGRERYGEQWKDDIWTASIVSSFAVSMTYDVTQLQ